MSNNSATAGAYRIAWAATLATIPSATPYITRPMVTPPPPAVATATTGSATVISEALLAAKLEAVEAHTETKFAQLLGKLDVIGERLSTITASVTSLDGKVDAIDSHVRSARSTIIAFVIGTGIAVAGLAWGGIQLFQGGAGVTASAYQSGVAAAEAHKK